MHAKTSGKSRSCLGTKKPADIHHLLTSHHFRKNPLPISWAFIVSARHTIQSFHSLIRWSHRFRSKGNASQLPGATCVRPSVSMRVCH